jgi:purine-nucleoside phosphorylase
MTTTTFESPSRIEAAAEAIRHRWATRPRACVILGSGLGGLVETIDRETTIEYDELPHFGRSTAIGHAGRLVCGRLAGVPVVAMQGRSHLYEGYSAEQVTLPIRVMKSLGVELLMVSNAAGGLDPDFHPGEVMVIDDHVNLMFRNPPCGPNDPRLGPRFPDMSAPYDARLSSLVLGIARGEGFVCHRGVYVGMLGPTYETRAEYRFLRQIGGDAVGMSTVPEAIVASHAGLRVVGLSTIANVATPDAPSRTTGEEVVRTVQNAAGKIGALVDGVIRHEFK